MLVATHVESECMAFRLSFFLDLYHTFWHSNAIFSCILHPGNEIIFQFELSDPSLVSHQQKVAWQSVLGPTVISFWCFFHVLIVQIFHLSQNVLLFSGYCQALLHVWWLSAQRLNHTKLVSMASWWKLSDNEMKNLLFIPCIQPRRCDVQAFNNKTSRQYNFWMAFWSHQVITQVLLISYVMVAVWRMVLHSLCATKLQHQSHNDLMIISRETWVRANKVYLHNPLLLI